MDHPFPYLEDPRAGGYAFDLFTVGGFLAQATERIAIHLNIIVMGYRNPFLTACSICTLDHLARGRLIVGIGAGYMEREFDALGAEFARRGHAVDEGVVAMKAAWTGEPVTMDGENWKARGNSMYPTPFSDPHPRLLRGGNTRNAIRSAARNFDGWNPFEAPRDLANQALTAALDTHAELARRIAMLREFEEEFGRTTPLELSLDKPDPAWLGRGTQAIADEVGELTDLGIGQLVVYLPGSTVAEVQERIDSFAAAVLAPA
jgi:alkanesulfonate monooxygenase SsuD/methylene tetrahydromethanopterin reductase-like flavin-dependent oxidoreductase (luciferase family)